jgi:hypothetical protein
MEWRPHFVEENTERRDFFPYGREKREGILFLPEVDIDDADLGRVADQFEGSVDAQFAHLPSR